MEKKTNIYVIGDIHGRWQPVRDFWLRCKLSEAMGESENILICLGDFGANFFFDYRDEKFKKKLGTLPFTYFVIRGNHEERPNICAEQNPDMWHKEKFFDNSVWVENEYPYIKYALDEPALYNILGYKTLVLPGAYSVDKYYRLQNGWPWFENEQMTQEEMDLGIKICEENDWNIDIVLSHTAPNIYVPSDLFLTMIDQSTVDTTTERYLGQIEYLLKYRLWFWGHYHHKRVYPKDGTKQAVMLSNTEVVNLLDWLAIGKFHTFI